MVFKTTEALFVSANPALLTDTLAEDAYTVHTIDDQGKAMESLQSHTYELIILDDRLLQDDIIKVVHEIKRRVPLIPVIIMSAGSDAGYQTDLMEAGADDFFTPELPHEEIHRRLRLVSQRRRNNRALALRNQHLQAITALSRRLHIATDPRTLILEAIDQACRTFNLYGVALALGEGDMLQIYAGRQGASENMNLYESAIRAQAYDTFRRVIDSGFVQVFQDIKADPYYTPIPVLDKAESAIIVPLSYQEQTFGALAVFGLDSSPLTHNDILIYELFAGQFAIALNNARQYDSQRIDALSTRHQLRAWQRFISLQSFEEIAGTLRELVEDIQGVGQALVWLYAGDGGTIVRAANRDVEQVFNDLYGRGKIGELLDRLDERLRPISFTPGRGQSDPLGPLFRGLRGQQLMLVPITDSVRLVGGMLVSIIGTRQFSIEYINLLEGLAYSAGQALERTTLMNGISQQSARLEAILRTISEGIFFVDEGGNVAFINPQFTEYTGISPSEVLNVPSANLLESIAAQSVSSDRVRVQLQEAVNSIVNNNEMENYPIIEVRLLEQQRDVHIELVVMSSLGERGTSWAGIVRDHSRFKTLASELPAPPQAATPPPMFDIMGDRIRVPYARLRGQLATLMEQHSSFSHRQRDRFLREIEHDIENLGQMWDNMIETSRMQGNTLDIARESTDLHDLVQRVVNSRTFADFRRQISVEAPPRLLMIDVDEPRIEQVFRSVLQNAVRFSPEGAPVTIRIEPLERELRIIVQDQGIGIPAGELEQVFDPFVQASNNDSEQGAGLGLYISRRLVQSHGGDIWAESTVGRGTTVTIALPLLPLSSGDVVNVPVTKPYVPAEPVRRPLPTPSAVMPEREPLPGSTGTPVRRPQSIMVVEGLSSIIGQLRQHLEGEDYQILAYKSGEEALQNLNAIRLDLVVLDANLRDANGLDICERMHRRTEVPILMVTDEGSEAEKLRALSREVGADEYISRPISNQELFLRVDKMLDQSVRPVHERTREPLQLGGLYIDFARREVFLNNAPLELTRIEYDLLHNLVTNMGQVLTHKQLLAKVWGPEYQAETQYLWVNVSRLRKKLEPTADSPRYIHTQTGIGYVFRKP